MAVRMALMPTADDVHAARVMDAGMIPAGSAWVTSLLSLSQTSRSTCEQARSASYILNSYGDFIDVSTMRRGMSWWTVGNTAWVLRPDLPSQYNGHKDMIARSSATPKHTINVLLFYNTLAP